MPGWETDPNVNAADIMAFGYNFMGKRTNTVGQFPTDEPTEKVQGFFDRSDKTNISIRFDLNQFPE